MLKGYGEEPQRVSNKDFPKTKHIVGGVIIFILLLLLWKSATIIPAGFQGVITRWGAIKGNTLSPGFHFVVPISDGVRRMEIREKKIEVEADSASKDLQEVSTTIALNYHLDPSNINNLYQEVGVQYQTRIIDPAIQESVKAGTALFTAEELITKRPEVKTKIKDLLSDRLATRYISVDDLAIVNFQFSEEFDSAIEDKQVAEQQAQKAQRDLERIKLEAEQKIANARAEA